MNDCIATMRGNVGCGISVFEHQLLYLSGGVDNRLTSAKMTLLYGNSPVADIDQVHHSTQSIIHIPSHPDPTHFIPRPTPTKNSIINTISFRRYRGKEKEGATEQATYEIKFFVVILGAFTPPPRMEAPMMKIPLRDSIKQDVSAFLTRYVESKGKRTMLHR